MFTKTRGFVQMTIYEALANAGVSLQPDFTGQRIRGGRKDVEWLYGHEWDFEGKHYQQCFFGSFLDMVKHEWKSWEGEKLSKKENTELFTRQKQLQEKLAKEKNENHERTRQKCSEEFARLPQANTEIYLGRKSISLGFGGKISMAATPLKPSEIPHLVIPLHDIDQRIWSLQHIYHEGDKTFEKGGKKQGLFYLLPTAHHTWFDGAPETIFIAEGFATTCSIQEALGDAAYCCVAYDSGNLLPVGKILRQRYPHAKLVYCADNDSETVLKGKPVNVGYNAAREACGVTGNFILCPFLKDNDKGDFNDLHCADGLSMVKSQISDQMSEQEKLMAGGAEVPKSEEMPKSLVRWTQDGKPILPTQHLVAQLLLKNAKDRIYKQESPDGEDIDRFAFNDFYWQKIGISAKDHYKQRINMLCENMMGWKKLGEYTDYFLGACPAVPPNVNMFCPPFDKVAFQNGTLRLKNPEYGKYELIFEPRFEPKDYLTSQLPFDYIDHDDKGCPLTDMWLSKAFAGDADAEDKIRLYWQICGSMLIQIDPKIFLFLGEPGTGKSTAIQLAIKLIDRKSLSKLSMPQMKGFDLADMINCRVNYDTDMDTANPIVDEFVKKICDDDGARVPRKFKSGADATMPKIHLFGANKIPKIQDGENNPFDRRMIIVTFNNKTTQGQFSSKYWNYLWQQESNQIIAKAIAGLKDLIQNGCRYTIPKSSVFEVNEMALNSDPYSQFLHDVIEPINGFRIKDSKAKIQPNPNKSVSLRIMFEFFKSWMSENSLGTGKSDYNERRKLCAALRSKKYECKKSNGEVCVKGFESNDLFF